MLQPMVAEWYAIQEGTLSDTLEMRMIITALIRLWRFDMWHEHLIARYRTVMWYVDEGKSEEMKNLLSFEKERIEKEYAKLVLQGDKTEL